MTYSKKEAFWQKKTVVFLVALFCCFLWGSATPAIKTGYAMLGIESSNTAAQMLFAGIRFTLAGIMAVIIGSVKEKRVLKPSGKTMPSVLLLALVQTVIQYFFFYTALANTSGVQGSIIQGANAFIALLVASLIFRMETLTARKIVGSVIGFVGMAVINLAGGSFGTSWSILGEGAMILSMISYAFSSVLTRKFSQNEHPFTLSGYQFFLGGIVLALIGFFSGGRITFTGPSLVLLAYLAFISAAAYSLWGMLLKYNSVASVTVFTCATPIFGTLLSAVFLGEAQQAFSIQSFIALVLICAGIIIVNKEKKLL